jgi:lipopolysaccharide/colanic/teichoic acid biosynthesis glycosyltransferase
MKIGQQTTTAQTALTGRLPETVSRAEDVQERVERTSEKTRTSIELSGSEPHISYFIVKRLVDVVGSLCGILLLAPFWLVLTLLIALDSPGPVIHRRRVLARQTYRSDDQLETFDAYKFRTMVVNADAVLKSDAKLYAEYRKEFKLVDDPRVTRIGAKIRRLSLDELPQLFNVLRGQMTLVGPRMITPPELENYGPYRARLLKVKPGLTGLWQVSGRTNIPYNERVRLDMYYIENRSILLDLQILWRTVGTVLARKGAV